MLGWYSFGLKYIDSMFVICNYSLLDVVLQLRVDGVLMRLRETRMHCSFRENTEPVILREICWREATFKTLAAVSVILHLASSHSSSLQHFLLSELFLCICP